MNLILPRVHSCLPLQELLLRCVNYLAGASTEASGCIAKIIIIKKNVLTVFDFRINEEVTVD